jgi:hypothetical protein
MAAQKRLSLTARELKMVRYPLKPCFGNWMHKRFLPRLPTKEGYDTGVHDTGPPPCKEKCPKFEFRLCRKVTLFLKRHE